MHLNQIIPKKESNSNLCESLNNFQILIRKETDRYNSKLNTKRKMYNCEIISTHAPKMEGKNNIIKALKQDIQENSLT